MFLFKCSFDKLIATTYLKSAASSSTNAKCPILKTSLNTFYTDMQRNLTAWAIMHLFLLFMMKYL